MKTLRLREERLLAKVTQLLRAGLVLDSVFSRWAQQMPAAAAAKSLQSCPTLCDPIDHSPPGSPVPGILQTRTLEWVAISFSNAWKWKVKVKSLSRVRLLVTPWTAAYQAPPSMGFPRQEHWSGCPCLLPADAWSMVITDKGQPVQAQALESGRPTWVSQLCHILPSSPQPSKQTTSASVFFSVKWE